MRSTQRHYRNSYLGLFEFDGPTIVSWTEFHDPLVFCRAFEIDAP